VINFDEMPADDIKPCKIDTVFDQPWPDNGCNFMVATIDRLTLVTAAGSQITAQASSFWLAHKGVACYFAANHDEPANIRLNDLYIFV